jgi:hypothetical protein
MSGRPRKAQRRRNGDKNNWKKRCMSTMIVMGDRWAAVGNNRLCPTLGEWCCMEKIFILARPVAELAAPMCTGSDDNLYSWTAPYFHDKDPVDGPKVHISWMAGPENITSVTPLADTQVLNHAVETLTNTSSARNKNGGVGTPFFVAAGFHKPHLPFVFPEKYLDFVPH